MVKRLWRGGHDETPTLLPPPWNWLYRKCYRGWRAMCLCSCYGFEPLRVCNISRRCPPPARVCFHPARPGSLCSLSSQYLPPCSRGFCRFSAGARWKPVLGVYLLSFNSKLFLIHLTCPVRFSSCPVGTPFHHQSREMIQSIHSNRTSQSAPSSLGTRPVTGQPTANQNREQIITRLPNVTRMLRARWSHAHVTQPQNMKSPKYLFVCACILFCDWIDVFIVILWLDCSTDI